MKMYIKKHPIIGTIILIASIDMFTSAVCFVFGRKKKKE